MLRIIGKVTRFVRRERHGDRTKVIIKKGREKTVRTRIEIFPTKILGRGEREEAGNKTEREGKEENWNLEKGRSGANRLQKKGSVRREEKNRS